MTMTPLTSLAARQKLTLTPIFKIPVKPHLFFLLFGFVQQ
jgi:hypothetical protein